MEHDFLSWEKLDTEQRERDITKRHVNFLDRIIIKLGPTAILLSMLSTATEYKAAQEKRENAELTGRKEDGDATRKHENAMAKNLLIGLANLTSYARAKQKQREIIKNVLGDKQ